MKDSVEFLSSNDCVMCHFCPQLQNKTSSYSVSQKNKEAELLLEIRATAVCVSRSRRFSIAVARFDRKV